MSKALILYASQKGSTAEVARFLADLLKQAGHEADTANADSFQDDIHDYDAVILGTGIYKGLWIHSLLSQTMRLEEQFGNKPVWGFALCIRVMEIAGEDYARQFYLPNNFLYKVNLQDYQFFAGQLRDLTMAERNTLSERYDGQLRHQEGDYRDWNAIRAWGNKIAEKLEKLEVLKSQE